MMRVLRISSRRAVSEYLRKLPERRNNSIGLFKGAAGPGGREDAVRRRNLCGESSHDARQLAEANTLAHQIGDESVAHGPRCNVRGLLQSAVVGGVRNQRLKMA